MPEFQAGSNEAVIFFRGDLVDKEVLYPEFEAILDGYIGLPGYANRVLKAVYLQISPRLAIQAAVFFTIPFAEDGQVETSWNIPLQHLADHGLDGPDLGEGAIRLACRSVCPVAWYKEQLWDPDLQGNLSTFDLLKEAIKRNRLGLLVQRAAPMPKAAAAPAAPSPTQGAPGKVEAPPVPSGPRFNRKYRRRIEGLRQKHKLELRTLAERLKRRLDSAETQYQDNLKQRDEALREQKQRLSRSRRKELELKEALDNYEQQFNKIRELYEDSLKQGNKEYAAELDILRDQFAAELRDKLGQQAEELQERIAMRETELHYRDRQISRLREELASLKQQHQLLVKNDSGQVLQRMTESGITFVAYHPGIEHLVLSPGEIMDYLGNPIAFVAERCGVSEQHYSAWLKHYRLPVCGYASGGDQICGEPIDKVLKPKFFRPGEGDRCRAHQGLPVQEEATVSVSDSP